MEWSHLIPPCFNPSPGLRPPSPAGTMKNLTAAAIPWPGSEYYSAQCQDFTIADVFDTLTPKRPYKEPFQFCQ